jgi:hypothetical protein
MAIERGEKWTKDMYFKKNSTNAMYVRDADRLEADKEIEKLARFLRA